MRLFFLMYDHLPPQRVDVRVLFGDELPRFGIQSDVVGQVAVSRVEDLAWAGGDLFPAGALRRGLFGEAIRPFQDLIAIGRHLRKVHRVIQVRDKIRTGVLCWVVARLTGRKIVYWMSFPFAEGFVVRAREVGRTRGLVFWAANWARAWLAERVYYGFLASRVDHLFVQSDEMRRMMAREAGVPAERMTVVPMGVDASWLGRDRDVLGGIPPIQLQGRRVLGYVGTLGRSRQPEFLVQVLETVRKTEPAAFLLLIGDAPSADEQTWLRSMIAASPSADSIHLTGWLPPEEGQRWLAHAELGFSPIPRGRLFDVGSPTKALEYLAQGLPCVGNDNPDQQWVLEQSGAGLCVPMEVDAFAAACLRILGDAELARTLGERGPPWVAEHRSYAVLARQVAAAYHRCLGNDTPVMSPGST